MGYLKEEGWYCQGQHGTMVGAFLNKPRQATEQMDNFTHGISNHLVCINKITYFIKKWFLQEITTEITTK